jgi:biopolymer transport protein ExbD
LNNLDFEKPKITIKRDAEIEGKANDQVVSIEELQEELTERNNQTGAPIFIDVEFRVQYSFRSL